MLGPFFILTISRNTCHEFHITTIAKQHLPKEKGFKTVVSVKAFTVVSVFPALQKSAQAKAWATVSYQSGVDGGKWCKWWLVCISLNFNLCKDPAVSQRIVRFCG